MTLIFALAVTGTFEEEVAFIDAPVTGSAHRSQGAADAFVVTIHP